MNYCTVNPTTLDVLAGYDYLDDGAIETRIADVYQGYLAWRQTPPSVRADALRAIARQLRADNEDLALPMALEMGKPLREGRAEIEKCALACEHFAARIADLLQPQKPSAHYPQTLICFEALGPILAIMPWNFPFWQVFRCAVAAWAAGNTILLKHADAVTECARRIDALIAAAVPDHTLLRHLPISHAQTTKLIHDPRVRGVTFTGSTTSGREIAREAGLALKKSVLELGGNDAYLILADADVRRAAAIGAAARLINNGQSCIAAKRFIVESPVLDDFTAALIDAMQAYRVGDPLQEATDLGPLAALHFRDGLQHQLRRLLDSGGERLWQGQAPSRGAFFPPTVVRIREIDSELAAKEIFGPIAVVTPATDVDDAIRRANQTPYGLGAAIFTANVEHGRQIAEHQLEAGTVVINDFVRSDPRVPIGGIKSSGYGRELGDFGFYEFVNIKTIGIGAASA